MDENKQGNVDVSVVMTTYGHEDFILKAINGVVSQEFNGVIELIISNDKSPDNTHQVVEKYIKENPCPSNIIIRYYNHEVNKGSIKNFIWTFKQAKGEFIAVCEGDDYWIDVKKIQRQVDYLNENQDCNLVYHRVLLYENEEGRFMHETLNKEEECCKKTIEEISNGNFIHTPSVLCRNNLKSIDLLEHSLVGDYVLWFLNGEMGKYGYLPQFMAVYRMSNISIFGKKSIYFQSIHVLKAVLNLKNYTKVNSIKNNFILQSQRISEDIGISALSGKEFLDLFKIMVKISPSNAAYLIKRLATKISFKGAAVIAMFFSNLELYAA